MKFTVNMGFIDRIFRTLVGIVLIYLGFFSENLINNDTLRYILSVLGAFNILTAVSGFCVLYVIANINTYSKA